MASENAQSKITGTVAVGKSVAPWLAGDSRGGLL
jgi:hypothetical protein